MRPDKELYSLLVSSDCYTKTVDSIDKGKVLRRRRGESTSQPGSKIGKVAWELGYRTWLAEQPPEPPPPPPPTDKTTHPPLVYNQVPGGADARYNIHINCHQTGPNNYADNDGLNYDDGGRAKDTRFTTHVDGLKSADMMDGKEPWEAYEWGGRTFPPYPDECYRR